MQQPVLAVIAGKAKGLGLVTAAVLAGGIAGGVLSSGAASGATTPNPSATHRAQHGTTNDDTGSPDAQGVHGRCVSKVAQDPTALGGPHHNHGGAVSAAAHSCPH